MAALLNQLILIFALAIPVAFICQRLRIPSIVGFLLTGVIAGPHALRLIPDVGAVNALAELGVVLLLFTVGIELNIKDLLRIKRAFFLGGTLQVCLTVGAVWLVASFFGASSAQGLLWGFLIALSSTAIVVKILQERSEMESAHGRIAVAVLIFQDIVAVLMLLLIPVLAGGSFSPQGALMAMTKGVAVVALIVISALWLVPKLLHAVATAKSRELFILSVVVLSFCVAWLTSSVGLSFAIGAFLAGLILSESHYGHQALAHILPFRDVFTSLFFVSLGMLVDWRVAFAQPWIFLLLVVVILFIKTLMAAMGTLLMGMPVREAANVGFSLAQVGEFSFVLAGVGVTSGFLTGEVYSLFLAVSVVTMAVTPLMMTIGRRLEDAITSLNLPRQLRHGFAGAALIPQRKHGLTDHTIIVGYGVTGQRVAAAAKRSGVKFAVIEINVETVRRERRKRTHVFFGDAYEEAVLMHAGICEAKVLVIAIADPLATRKITAVARSLNPSLHIVARTRFESERKVLQGLGASAVVADDHQAALALAGRALKPYGERRARAGLRAAR